MTHYSTLSNVLNLDKLLTLSHSAFLSIQSLKILIRKFMDFCVCRSGHSNVDSMCFTPSYTYTISSWIAGLWWPQQPLRLTILQFEYAQLSSVAETWVKKGVLFGPLTAQAKRCCPLQNLEFPPTQHRIPVMATVGFLLVQRDCLMVLKGVEKNVNFYFF